MALNREQILTAPDRKREEFPVLEWGGSVFIQEFSGADRDFYENAQYELIENSETGEIKAHAKKTSRAQTAALVVSLSVVDPAGIRIFAEADIPELLKKNPEVLERIAKAAFAINGLGADEVKKAEANFEGTPGDPGYSSLP